jgi:hypothetical protein
MRDEAPVFWRNFGNLFPAAACSHLQADLTDVLESIQSSAKVFVVSCERLVVSVSREVQGADDK